MLIFNKQNKLKPQVRVHWKLREVQKQTPATMETTNYVEKHLPPEIVQKLEAGAFQSVCNHLRERSDDVQNLDIMTVSGFCRNCLAKVCRLNGIYMSERDSC